MWGQLSVRAIVGVLFCIRRGFGVGLVWGIFDGVNGDEMRGFCGGSLDGGDGLRGELMLLKGCKDLILGGGWKQKEEFSMGLE